jgi:hypothetical protein
MNRLAKLQRIFGLEPLAALAIDMFIISILKSPSQETYEASLEQLYKDVALLAKAPSRSTLEIP